MKYTNYSKEKILFRNKLSKLLLITNELLFSNNDLLTIILFIYYIIAISFVVSWMVEENRIVLFSYLME